MSSPLKSAATVTAAERDTAAEPSPAATRSGARYLRRRLKGPAALAVRRGAEAAGVSYHQLGLAIDAPKQRVGRMASAAHDDVIDLVRARMAPALVRKELARFVVDVDALVIDAPVVIACSEAERSYRLTKEANDLATVRAENLRDGFHDLNELEAELKELREDLAVKLEHEAHLVAKIAAMRGGGR
jgi:hypothetical protein